MVSCECIAALNTVCVASLCAFVAGGSKQLETMLARFFLAIKAWFQQETLPDLESVTNRP